MKVMIDGKLRQINEAKYQLLCKIAHEKKLNTIEEVIKCLQMKKPN